MARIVIPNEEEQKIKIIAQEIKFAKVLAGNDKRLRDKTLSKLKKWLHFRSQSSIPLTEESFMRLWKGLFYCMWMSDKMLKQEECAERIADLIHGFKNKTYSILFFKCFLQTMIHEWFGIDQLRLNKFLMLIRRCLRQSLTIIKKCGWNKELINQFNDALCDTGLKNSSTVPLGLKMHITEIFLEELAKVSEGKLNDDLTVEFLRPFAKILSVISDQREIDHIHQNIFVYLLKQSSTGMEYEEKFEAWRSRGFPGGNINCIQKINTENESDDDNEQEDESSDLENMPKDPRAGQVDVILKQIPFKSEQIIRLLKEYQFNKGTNTKSRKAMNVIINLYEKLNQGKYPLGINKVSIPSSFLNTQKAAKNLLKFEEELYFDNPNILTKTQKRKLKLTQSQCDKLLENEEHLKEKKRKENINKANDDNDDALEKFIQKSEKNLFKNGFIAREFLKETNNKKKEKSSSNVKSNKNNCKKIVDEKVNDSCKSSDFKKEKKLKILENKIEKLKKPIVIGIAQPSGVWEVTDTECSITKDSKPKVNCKVSKTEQKVNKSKKSNKGPLNESNSLNTLLQSSLKKKTIKSSVPENKLKKSQKKTSSCIKNEIFPQTEWDVPSKSGEIEIFIPSKKYLKKDKKNSNQTSKQCIQKTNNKLVKLKKDFVTNSANKKVKIALQKNKVQDRIDYIKQVRSSPAIPFDSTKKPSKSLLKPTNIKIPINPFYKLKDSFF